MAQSNKTKASKRQVEHITRLEEENAQLRKENAKLKKAPGASKVQDAYYSRTYNTMVDYAVFQEKYYRKEINEVPIEMYSLDSCHKPPIRELRALVRSLMTKSPGKLEASKYPEE